MDLAHADRTQVALVVAQQAAALLRDGVLGAAAGPGRLGRAPEMEELAWPGGPRNGRTRKGEEVVALGDPAVRRDADAALRHAARHSLDLVRAQREPRAQSGHDALRPPMKWDGMK